MKSKDGILNINGGTVAKLLMKSMDVDVRYNTLMEVANGIFRVYYDGVDRADVDAKKNLKFLADAIGRLSEELYKAGYDDGYSEGQYDD